MQDLLWLHATLVLRYSKYYRCVFLAEIRQEVFACQCFAGLLVTTDAVRVLKTLVFHFGLRMLRRVFQALLMQWLEPANFSHRGVPVSLPKKRCRRGACTGNSPPQIGFNRWREHRLTGAQKAKQAAFTTACKQSAFTTACKAEVATPPFRDEFSSGQCVDPCECPQLCRRHHTSPLV